MECYIQTTILTFISGTLFGLAIQYGFRNILRNRFRRRRAYGTSGTVTPASYVSTAEASSRATSQRQETTAHEEGQTHACGSRTATTGVSASHP